jgi:hypothetical protein
MVFIRRMITILKDLDQRIQLSRIPFEDENFRTCILKKYGKKNCSCCNGKGFVSEDQPL